jgi:DNA-binding transcriptional LysR family regulator
MAALDLVRGFVAVGRRMSITLAAEDLCVTQSAVSRQVHALEERLGVTLFVRGYRSIAFTPEGARLFRVADAAVQQLQDAMGALATAGDRVPVTVTASIGVAALWLLPRLTRFQQRHPEIDVRIAANNRVLDLRTEGIDLAIRYSRQDTLPSGAVALFGEAVVPVAHPSLRVGPLGSPRGVAAHVLLDYDDPGRPWLQWADRLAALGPRAVKPRGVLRFNQYDQVIQAALAGQGIALGRLPLVTPMLADGRLVAIDPADNTVEARHAYWLIAASDEPRDDVRTVIQWIRDEARAGARRSRPGVARSGGRRASV